MRNVNKNRWLSLLVLSLCATLSLYGCTTNRTPGNGQPTSAPSYGPTVPTVTPGTSGGTTPPMTSAGFAPVLLGAQHTAQSAADQAAAMMAHRRIRVLGQSSPNPGYAQIGVAQSAQFISPAQQVNPQQTINSSSTSQPNTVISTGAGDNDGINDNSAALFGNDVNQQTPATAGITLVPGAFASGTSATPSTQTVGTTPTTTLTPTLSSGSNLTPTAATSPIRVQSNGTGGVVITNTPR